jgi:hypothetical protein
MKTLLAGTLLFMVLANVPLLLEEGRIWLNESIVVVLLTLLFLFSVNIISADAKEKIGHFAEADQNSINNAHKKKGITKLHLGVLGGIIGVCMAGLLMRAITEATQSYMGLALVLCGLLGGLGFGALSRGDRRMRGIIGCCFGVIAIFFGLVMAYNTPIIIGYWNDGTALLKWHDASFLMFAQTRLLSMSGLFYTFFGLLAAYFAGSTSTLKNQENLAYA